MKDRKPLVFALLLIFLGMSQPIFSANFFPASHPHIQYAGRWERSDSLQAKHSWPGVTLAVRFTGKSISVRMTDDANFYNAYVDGKLQRIIACNSAEAADYLIADSLAEGAHTLLLTKRNCAQNKIAVFLGFVLAEGAQLLPPLDPRPARRIEFIGDSFTVAEGNEATAAQMPWLETFPVTNIDKSFATILARHFNAEYHITARSGIGMVTDWSGDHALNMPDRFDRALMDAPEPKWNFQSWTPQLVVVCLGLNDYSGLKDKTGNVSEENSARYRKRYHDFIATLRSVYPNAKILAVAAHVEWIRANVRQIVANERAEGRENIFYAQFDYFENGYVANGHPSAATQEKIAAQVLAQMEQGVLLKF